MALRREASAPAAVLQLIGTASRLASTPMAQPTTSHDIIAILDRLATLPKLGRPLRDDPSLRERLGWTAEQLAERQAPRGEIESHLRWQLRRVARMD